MTAGGHPRLGRAGSKFRSVRHALKAEPLGRFGVTISEISARRPPIRTVRGAGNSLDDRFGKGRLIGSHRPPTGNRAFTRVALSPGVAGPMTRLPRTIQSSLEFDTWSGRTAFTGCPALAGNDSHRGGRRSRRRSLAG
jgi:hypothetical protein